MGLGRPLLGIDLGTSGVKAGIFDPAGPLLGFGRAGYEVLSPHPGWAETDPAAWWEGTCSAISAACSQAHLDPADISSVGLSVLFPAVMLLGPDAVPLSRALLYCDQRSLAQIRAIERAIPRDEFQSLVGNTLAPGNSAVTSILWLRDDSAAAFSSARVIAWANTYLVAKLTGHMVTDPCMAALSGLVDIREPRRWNPSLCERLGVPLEKLPVILRPDEVAGTVSEEAHVQTGLRLGVPVVCGSGDTPSAVFGAGAASPGEVVYSAGSTDCVTTPLSRPTRDLRWVSATCAVDDLWCAIGTTTSSGASVAWFCREILGRDDGEARRALSELAVRSPAGANGLLFLPYLQGERTPIWDPLARGVFFGLSASTTRADMARAVLEGTAFGLRGVMDSLEEVAERPPGQPQLQIRAVGGGTGNALWNSIKASVLGRPLSVLGFQETGVLGAALLSGMGCGTYRSSAEAVAVARSVGKSMEVTPEPALARVYEELYPLFGELYPKTAAIAHALACRTGGERQESGPS
jgi:xylulokinase